MCRSEGDRCLQPPRSGTSPLLGAAQRVADTDHVVSLQHQPRIVGDVGLALGIHMVTSIDLQDQPLPDQEVHRPSEQPCLRDDPHPQPAQSRRNEGLQPGVGERRGRTEDVAGSRGEVVSRELRPICEPLAQSGLPDRERRLERLTACECTTASSPSTQPACAGAPTWATRRSSTQSPRRSASVTHVSTTPDRAAANNSGSTSRVATQNRRARTSAPRSTASAIARLATPRRTRSALRAIPPARRTISSTSICMRAL